MADTEYDVGDQLHFYSTFTNESGDLADPTVVTAKIRRPDKSVSILANGRISVGYYEAFVILDQSGHWWLRWESTGAITSAEETEIVVRRSRVL